jgi:hypothetical protein
LCTPHDPGTYILRASVVYINGSDIQPPPPSPHLLPIFVGYGDVAAPEPVVVSDQQEQEQEQQEQEQEQPLCFSPSARHVTDALAYQGRWISKKRCSECNCSHVHSQVLRREICVV